MKKQMLCLVCFPSGNAYYCLLCFVSPTFMSVETVEMKTTTASVKLKCIWIKILCNVNSTITYPSFESFYSCVIAWTFQPLLYQQCNLDAFGQMSTKFFLMSKEVFLYEITVLSQKIQYDFIFTEMYYFC